MQILTSLQSRELDKISASKFGIKGKTLMGNAGQKIANTILNFYSDTEKLKILIVCGKGNNGGDGFATALSLKKFNPQVFMIYSQDSLSVDANHYYQECIEKNIDIQFHEYPPNSHEFNLIIDAMLGIGIKGEVRSPVSEWIPWMNNQHTDVISVDIPSGLNADTGQICGDVVNANITVTMGNEKTGMLFHPGKDQCGKIITADIGFPTLEKPLSGIHWNLYDEEDGRKFLVPPPKDSYKHKQGKVLVIAGSKGMAGAAILTGMSALKCGAGLVKCCIPESLNPIFESAFMEGISIPCSDNNSGTLGQNNFEEINNEIDWCDSVIIGPGLGTELETQELIVRILSSCSKPVVVDADALFLIDKILENNSLSNNSILTPHLGEFGKMVNQSNLEVEENFISIIEEFMVQYEGTLVLKTTPVSVVHNGKGSINISGNQGLASAGTGDVLAGCIGSFIAQGLTPFDAGKLGVFIHGKAADILIDQTGYRGMTATDVINEIPKVIRQYEIESL